MVMTGLRLLQTQPLAAAAFEYASVLTPGLRTRAEALAGEAEALAAAGAEAAARGEAPDAAAGRRAAELAHVVALSQEVASLTADIEALNELMAEDEAAGEDDEAAAEFAELADGLATAERALRAALVPRDPEDDADVVLEIRAGAGGGEASLFAAEMFAMYSKYAARRGWRVDLLAESVSAVGGSQKVVAEVKAPSKRAYAALKYESGVHRVQRIPETETTGRVHTSTVSVAVMPLPDSALGSANADIPESDLRIDTYRASGAGGQHVNTTDSAVRITHLPTGLVVTMQDERSQHKNKRKALRILGARLYELEIEQRQAEQATLRNALIGSAARSERIRTYNFPQSRVTDHRIGLTKHDIDAMMAGELLDEFSAELDAAALDDKLAALEAESDASK
ncbi:chain release factor A [Thecamonas trahens ATCC 50062]|uniref:Chain release factor A n=1 Tax=Thecamonas trahens ATCC 50062 TaxID=461836 RepID=A0A0L0DVR4_THETB|nr:chain release factor A [Thecamonas trahens ATCC 50062]KNC56409.1 chain release factor A [Thecamonas trahens ATCC 50062]|eukprot:XP_013760922.1 chain release factor A [Thecamonas trahens ATCC 50062]